MGRDRLNRGRLLGLQPITDGLVGLEEIRRERRRADHVVGDFPAGVPKDLGVAEPSRLGRRLLCRPVRDSGYRARTSVDGGSISVRVSPCRR